MSVQSIERAFHILRAVAKAPEGIGITELAQRTDLHKSTVSRLVAALEAEAAVVRVPATGEVRLGDALLAMVAAPQSPAHLAALARPSLLQLSAALGETVGLCVPEGDFAYYIDQVNSHHAVQVRNWTGERYPLHVTASGKLFLAYAAAARRQRYLTQPLAAYTPHTLATPLQLRARLDQVRQNGCDWAFEEFEIGLVVVAGPIFGAGGEAVASIYACGPIYRFPPPDRQEATAATVLAACAQVSALVHRSA